MTHGGKLKVAVKIPPSTTPLQCVSPVSRAFPLVAFEDIACDMFEPYVRTTWLVHWFCCASTPQRKRQQELAHTLQFTALEFNSVHKLSTCREPQCKMCVTGILHAYAFPKTLRTPAFDHGKLLLLIRLLRFSLHMCLCILVRGWKCVWTTVWIPVLQNLPRIFGVLEPDVL